MGKTRWEHFVWYMRVYWTQILYAWFGGIVVLGVGGQIRGETFTDDATWIMMGLTATLITYHKWLLAKRESVTP